MITKKKNEIKKVDSTEVCYSALLKALKESIRKKRRITKKKKIEKQFLD